MTVQPRFRANRKRRQSTVQVSSPGVRSLLSPRGKWSPTEAADVVVGVLQIGEGGSNRHPALAFCLSMISAQTLRVWREGKPVPTFPDYALARAGTNGLLGSFDVADRSAKQLYDQADASRWNAPRRPHGNADRLKLRRLFFFRMRDGFARNEDNTKRSMRQDAEISICTYLVEPFYAQAGSLLLQSDTRWRTDPAGWPW